MPAQVFSIPRRTGLSKKQEGKERVLSLWQEALDVARERRPLLAMRLSFYLGQHYGIMSDESVRRRAAVDQRIAWEVYNYVRPGVKTLVGQRMSFYPNSRVLPKSADVRDRYIAKTTESILRGMTKSGAMTRRTLLDATTAMEVYGWSYLKTYWSPIPWQHHRPGPRVEYCSPLDVIHDPQATRWEEVRRVFHRKIRPISSLREEYPRALDGDEVDFDEPSEETGRRSPLLEYMGKRGWDGLGEVIEMWEYPSAENDYAGRLVCFSGQTFFYDVPLPYQVPFQIMSGSNKNPENLTPDGAAADVYGISMSKNRTESNLAEALSLTSNPAMLVPRQAKVRQGAFVAVAGERIDYDAPWAPTWFFGPGPSPSSLALAQHQKDSIFEIMGTDAVLRGGTAPTNQPAKQTAFQKELFNENNAADNGVYQEELQSVQRQYLRLLHDYMPEDELLMVVGENGRAGVRQFKSRFVDFEPHLVIEQDDGPQSVMSRIDMAQELLRNGFFEDTPAAQKARRWARVASDEGPGQDLYEVNVEQAEKEEMEFLETGVVPPVLPQELNEAHIDCHGVFINSQAFLELPPESQQAFIEGHMRPTQEQLMLKMGGMPGAGMGPGGETGEGAAPAQGAISDGGRPEGGPDMMATEEPVEGNRLPDQAGV